MASAQEVLRARALGGRLVLGVQELALVDRETAAADAGVEAVAERLQRGDPSLEVLAPALREPLPVAARGSAVRGKRRERGADAFERDARGAPGLDEGEAAEDGSFVAALVALRALGADQAFALVEPQRGGRDAASGRDLSDRQVGHHLT